MLSAAFWWSGMILCGIAGAPEKHGELAWAVVVYLVIFAAFLLLGWAKGLYTVRNVGLPLVIDVVLAGWIWSVKPRS